MTERQLSDLLHEATPEPPSSIDLAAMAGRIQRGTPPARQPRRWFTPVTAAAAVITVVAAAAGIAKLTDGTSPSPTAVSTVTDSPTVKAPGGPQFTWARKVVERWEQQSAKADLVPLGADWDFQQVGVADRAVVLALGARRIVSGVALPDQAPATDTITWADGATRPATVLSAKAGFDRMITGGTSCQQCPTDMSANDLRTVTVTGATLTTMRVQTTRGEATVPAWRFSFSGTAVQVLQAAVQADVVTPAMTTSTQTAGMVAITRAEVSPDGRTLTVSFPRTSCGRGYTADVVESTRAVGIVVLEQTSQLRTPCAALLKSATTTVTLTDALKDRAVLETVRGTAVPVVQR